MCLSRGYEQTLNQFRLLHQLFIKNCTIFFSYHSCRKKKVSGSYWSHTSLQFKSPTMSGVVCTNILSCFDYHGGSCECIFARISRLLLCKGHQQEMIGRKHRPPPKKREEASATGKITFSIDTFAVVPCFSWQCQHCSKFVQFSSKNCSTQ